MSMNELQAEIGEWGDSNFGPEVDVVVLKNKLRGEVDELDLALASSGNTRSDAVEDEAADVAIYLLRLAYRLGFSLLFAVVRKMIVNRARKWPRDRSIPDVVPARLWCWPDPT